MIASFIYQVLYTINTINKGSLLCPFTSIKTSKNTSNIYVLRRSLELQLFTITFVHSQIEPVDSWVW